MLAARGAAAVDLVVTRDEKDERTLAGRILVKAQDNGLLFQTADGALWRIPPERQVRLDRDEQPFAPLSQEAQGKAALSQLPAGFDVYRTRHYVICHNSSKAYAMWCGALFERLYRGFFTYWTNRGFKPKEPEFPLTAVVFGDEASYLAANKEKLGAAGGSIVGFYDPESNRVAMYDLTGVAAVRQAGDKRGSSAQINEILLRPQAALGVATIIHEATHQLAYNCGLHPRLADVPRWTAEGLSLHFETPDLGSSQGWRTIGAVNQRLLPHMKAYLATRPADSLVSLLATDGRMRDAKQITTAYAEAWALTHFLLTRRGKAYVEYTKTLSQKSPLVWDEPGTRIKEFRAAFGDDLTKLDAEFIKHVRQLK